MGPGRSGSFSSMLISKVVGFKRAKTRFQFLWFKLPLTGSSYLIPFYYLDPKCVLHTYEWFIATLAGRTPKLSANLQDDFALPCRGLPISKVE